MKYIITEQQYRLLSEEEDKVDDPIEILRKSTDLIYDFGALSNDWNLAVRLAKGRPFIIKGNLNLKPEKVITLGSLVGVEGYLDLGRNKTIESLGDLQYVLGYLDLGRTNIEDLKNLKYVGGELDLRRTPLSQKMTEEDIRNIPNLTINGNIYI